MTKKIKILVADDEAFNLDIIMEYLEAAGYEVVCADDGDTALEKLTQHADISLIVIDRMMPRMDGMKVVEKIMADPRLCKIPVIMQTAAAATSQVLDGMSAGVFSYLSKPYEEEELLGTIKEALNS